MVHFRSLGCYIKLSSTWVRIQRSFGKWDVVSGCTYGIGNVYTTTLTNNGMSTVLISWTESKLQDLKKKIDEKGYNGVETEVVVCDYSKFDQKSGDTVSAAIKDVGVGILINNVGVSYY